MTAGEINTLVEVFLEDDKPGYLFGFTYAEHDAFYTRYCDLPNVDVAAARARHTSTRRAFRAILEVATPAEQARIIRGVFEKIPPEGFEGLEGGERRQKAARQLALVADRLDGMVVASPTDLVTSDTVQRALSNAEDLLRSSGPVAAVDRVHTALHGHLRHLCTSAGIVVTNADPGAEHYLTALINEHPKLQVPGVGREEVRAILRTSMAIVARISTIRNRASLAHPNEELLGPDEALLAINVAKSLLKYLDGKLGA